MFCPLKTVKKMEGKKKKKKRVGKGRRHNHLTKHNSSDIYSSTKVQHSSTVEARGSMSTNSLTQITQTLNNKLLLMFRTLCNPCSNINQFQRQHEERAGYCRLKMCAHDDNDRVGTTSAVENNNNHTHTQKKGQQFHNAIDKHKGRYVTDAEGSRHPVQQHKPTPQQHRLRYVILLRFTKSCVRRPLWVKYLLNQRILNLCILHSGQRKQHESVT